jgi:2,4-dienoyl-CoA reductase-like NADH-dependent reductase (Old Yellow Enzyme family)
VTGRAVITVGSVGLSGEYRANWGGEVSRPASLDALIERLERGEFDLVAVGRALLNDAEWLHKMATGRFDALKPFTIDVLNRYA